MTRRFAILALCAGAGAAPLAAQVPAADTASAPARAPSIWRLGTEIGFTDISGNRQLRLLQAAFTAVHTRPQIYTLDSKLEIRYGESDGVEAARSAAYRLRYDRSPQAHIAPFVGLDAEYDRIRKIDLRVSGGAGVNLNLDYTDTRRTTLALGLVEEYERRATGTATLTDTRFHSRFALLRTIRPGVVFELNGKYQPSTAELSDYLAKADAGLRIALTTRLSFRTSYVWNRDSTPAPGVLSKDDRTLTTGLLIQW